MDVFDSVLGKLCLSENILPTNVSHFLAASCEN